MPTKCYIALQKEDDTIDVILCQYDGHLHGCGVKLEKYYGTYAKLRQLIDLGNLQSLGKTIGVRCFNKEEYKKQDYCVFLTRDLNKKQDQLFMTIEDIETLLSLCESEGVGLYVFNKDDKWYTTFNIFVEEENNELRVLSEVIRKL